MTGDTRDPNDVKQDLKYDHRNLLTGMRVVKKSVGGDGYETYQLMYNYDEAGNRVRKRVYFYQGEDPTPVFEEDDMTGSWDLVGDEYYVRDVSGKEIAVYHSYDLDHWNVWGTDNVGKINANGDKFFYIKDHLGSVRVVLNSDNQIVSAIDYDCWGYPLENRSYQSDNIDYKFTGKQRDAETGYDYFGARYYDARIANWTTTDPLLEKRIGYSPYNYVLRNPLILIDPDGRIDVPESYKEQYPKLYAYMKNNFEENVSGDKKIMEAFKITGMSEDKIKENLIFDKGPIKLRIKDLGYNDAKQKILGHWDSETMTIFVDPYYVNLLEKADDDALKVYEFLVQALILHEGAHAAQDLSSNSNSSDIDIGYPFEKLAFERIIDSYNKAVRTMNWRNYYAKESKRYKEIPNGN